MQVEFDSTFCCFPECRASSVVLELFCCFPLADLEGQHVESDGCAGAALGVSKELA